MVITIQKKRKENPFIHGSKIFRIVGNYSNEAAIRRKKWKDFNGRMDGVKSERFEHYKRRGSFNLLKVKIRTLTHPPIFTQPPSPPPHPPHALFSPATSPIKLLPLREWMNRRAKKRSISSNFLKFDRWKSNKKKKFTIYKIYTKNWCWEKNVPDTHV